MKKICVIGQFPPPMHGLSKALDTMYKGLEGTFELEKVNLTDNRNIIGNIIRILRSKAELFYFTISQTVGGNKRDLLLLKLIAMKKKKCIVHLHGGYYRSLVENEMKPKQRLANFNAMKKVTGAIVLSPSLSGIFEGMVPEDRIFSVPNCIDDAFMLGESEVEEKLAATSDKERFHVLYLSNFNIEKGYRNVLALALEEKKRAESGEKRTFQFDFAGAFFNAEEKEYFFRYIEENGLEDYVEYHGVVSGKTKSELLKKEDIFILLTRYPKEGQPISILEGMGNGMAVITTDHAAIGDTVKDGENGLVCARGEELDTAELYRKMLGLLPELSRIGRNNYQKICREYTQEQYLDNLKNILQNC